MGDGCCGDDDVTDVCSTAGIGSLSERWIQCGCGCLECPIFPKAEDGSRARSRYSTLMKESCHC